MSRIRASIIVPVRDGERTIAECIESLLSQSIPIEEYEIIIVDNGSRDATVEIARRFPVTLLSEEIPTSYAARNRGLAAAHAPIAVFTDADCAAGHMWLQSHLSAYESDRVAAAWGPTRHSDSRSMVEQLTSKLDPLGRRPGERPSLLTSNVSYLVETIRDVGGFDEALFTGGDVDLGWRVQARNGTVAWCEAAAVTHQHRSTLAGLARQYRRYGYSEILLKTLYRKAAGYGISPAEQLRRMARQKLALLVYLLSGIYRPFAVLFGLHKPGEIRFHLAFPWLMIVAEGNSLLGKLQALVKTRWYRKAPAARSGIWRPAGTTTSSD